MPAYGEAPSFFKESAIDKAIDSELSASQVRDQLVAAMRGSSLVIPDMTRITSHWPTGVHPEIERLEEAVMKRLEL